MRDGLRYLLFLALILMSFYGCQAVTDLHARPTPVAGTSVDLELTPYDVLQLKTSVNFTARGNGIFTLTGGTETFEGEESATKSDKWYEPQEYFKAGQLTPGNWTVNRNVQMKLYGEYVLGFIVLNRTDILIFNAIAMIVLVVLIIASMFVSFALGYPKRR